MRWCGLMPETKSAIEPAKTPEQRKSMASAVYRALSSGLQEKQSGGDDAGLAWRVLRAMSRHFVPGMIIRRRLNQALAYCHRPASQGDIGWDIVTSDRNKHLGPEEEKRRQEIADFVEHGGFRWAHPVTGQPGYWMGNGQPTFRFPAFCQTVLRNSLIFDAAPVRMEAGAGAHSESAIVKALVKPQPVAAYIPVPGDRVALAVREEYKPEYRKQAEDRVEYIIRDQDGQVQFELTWRDLAYWVRNVDDRPERGGYGHAELEDCVDVLTGAATGFKYNVTQFTENHVPPVIISVPAGTNEAIEEWLATLELSAGMMGGWHSVPVIAQDPEGRAQVQVTPVQERPGDMQWRDFLIFCINVICSLYCISAEEVGFQSYMSKQGASLQEADPESRILHGQDTGFVPLMTWFAESYNDSIISQFDDGAWSFVWKGLGRSSEERSLRLSQQRLQMGLTSQEQEQEWLDLNPRHVPLDLELWQQVHEEIYREHPDADDEPDILMAVAQKMYVQRGGTWSLATRIPMSQQALTLYMQEQQSMSGGGSGEFGEAGGEPPWGQQAPGSDEEDEQADTPGEDAAREGQGDAGGPDEQKPWGHELTKGLWWRRRRPRGETLVIDVGVE